MIKTALITGLTGQIAYGMLGRGSSVEPRSPKAYRMHGPFANLFASLAPEATPRSIGKSGGG